MSRWAKLSLAEKIQSLRNAASKAYDTLKARGTSQEAISEAVAQIRRDLELILEDAAKHDLKSCVEAIWEFEAQATAHESMARKYLNKAENDRQQTKFIKEALKARMIAEGVTEVRSGTYYVHLVKDPQGASDVSIR